MSSSSDETSVDPGDPGAGSRLRTAASLAVAWVFAFLILRIFAVSGYHWDTAFLVSTAVGLDGGPAVIFGTLMAEHELVAALLVPLLPMLLTAWLWGPRRHRPVVLLLTALGLVAFLALTVSFGEWRLPVASVVVFVVIAVVRRLPLDGRLRRAAMLVLGRVGWIAGVALLLIAAFARTPWVPAESIDTTAGFIADAYVLSVDPGYLSVLVEAGVMSEEREFVILRTSDVLSRS